MYVYKSDWLESSLKTRLGMQFYLDYIHKLPGHVLYGWENGSTAKVLVEVEWEVKGATVSG